MTIRLLITDDDLLVRAGLALILGGSEDIEVIGEATNGREAVDRVTLDSASDKRVDVVLMDIRMPVMDGITATRAIAAMDDPPKVIVLTNFDADDFVVRALASGASGFLLKDTPPADIVAAVRRVHDGEPMLSPTVTEQLIRQVTEGAPSGRAEAALLMIGQLTERERDVAIAVGRGASNAEVAADLHMSVATVKAHISHIFTKLGATNRVQVAICMHDAGLI
ncbi:MAG: response regulator transcription factor [Aeromicrobium sp.]